MFKNESPMQQKGRKTVEDSLQGLASMLALIAAFLVMPQIYEYTANPVHAYLFKSYGDYSLATLGTYVWTFLATACVYYFSKAMIVLSLMLIAQRLLFSFAF